MTNQDSLNLDLEDFPVPGVIIPEKYLQKRRAVEVVSIILISPVLFVAMLCISVTILLFDRGAVFFIQKRPGRDGKLFSMYKFRTMLPDADTSFLTSTHDRRVTKLGRLLRKYKLDELPQFINVLKGQMSIIGPRPVPEQFYHLYIDQIPHYSLRHTIRPGITGWAQVQLGYTETLEDEKKKLSLDLEYIENIGYSMDITIIKRTLRKFCRAGFTH